MTARLLTAALSAMLVGLASNVSFADSTRSQLAARNAGAALPAGGICASNPALGRLAPIGTGYRRADRRFGGIPSVAVSPKNGRLWRTYYAGPTDGEDVPDKHAYVKIPNRELETVFLTDILKLGLAYCKKNVELVS